MGELPGARLRGPHAGQPVLEAGEPPAGARAGLVAVHGRGATAADILQVAAALGVDGMAVRTPQARDGTWYPRPFTAPLEHNEPELSSALAVMDEQVGSFEASGIPAEAVVLLGFSQGACLVLEYAARHPRRYGGLVGYSGGLIGPDDVQRELGGSLAGTPVFLGCGDPDPHIPRHRVQHAADVLRHLGADVTVRLYPGLGHAVNGDELAIARGMLRQLTSG